MPSNMRANSFIFLLLILSFLSCSEYNKVLKSSDPELKFTKAVEYYKDGRCYQALPLFEELIASVRGTQRAEEAYYYFAKTHYCIEDYYLANYYLKNFVKTFPTSKYAEECTFLAAMCSFDLSPTHSLDQTETRLAIDDFQLFIDRYPYSELKDSCNAMIGELRNKLEKKSFEVAKLYYTTEKYRSAVVALNNALKEYPDSPYREEMLYLIVESNYKFAQGSVEEKKLGRFMDTIDSYYKFVANFPNSSSLKEAELYFTRSQKEVERLKREGYDI